MKAAYGSFLGAVAAVSVVLVSSGCQTTAEKSAELRRLQKHEVLAVTGVSVKSENPSVKVLYSAVVGSQEGTTAIVVGMRNTSSHALRSAPIEVTAKDGKGSVVYQNTGPGLQPSLTSVSLLEAGKDTVWVDDQVQATGVAKTATALVGTAKAASTIPKLTVNGARLSEEAGSQIELGGVANTSSVTQQDLVVYGVARKGSKVVAAGRAVLPEVTAGTTVPFQIYFVGDPRGAKVEVSAPPTTF